MYEFTLYYAKKDDAEQYSTFNSSCEYGTFNSSCEYDTYAEAVETAAQISKFAESQGFTIYHTVIHYKIYDNNDIEHI